jgi:fucose permease
MKIRTLPIFFAFFVMGFVDAVGTLVGFAREQFQLSGFMAGLLPFFGFIAFALFSVPGGVLMDKRGKKFLMLLSLAIVLVGQVVPAASVSSYATLVVAIFTIGIGMTLLQVAGNPIMRDVSEEGRFARNLTFAQFIKGLGSIAGPALAIALVGRGHAWNSIFGVFAVVVAVTLAGIAFLRVDEKGKTISLELTIDTKLSQVMEYFEIFLTRMVMCRRAAQFLACEFKLQINGAKLL